jgi:nicotinic acid mononucleotide adenylyltransferase
MTEFIVASRPGHHYRVPAGATVHRLETLELRESSSAIRAALARGERPPELPRPVYDYIRSRGLYDSCCATLPATS